MQETIIARRYAKAVIGLCSIEEVVQMHTAYALISKAFGIDKFCAIVASRIISREEKLALIKSFVEAPMTPQADKLLTLLVYNDRISLLPFVVLELKKFIDSKFNKYEATLYVREQLEDTQVSNIQDSLGKKLGIALHIVQQINTSLEGIKLEVVDLGIEVAFLKDKFTHELQDFILKAV